MTCNHTNFDIKTLRIHVVPVFFSFFLQRLSTTTTTATTAPALLQHRLSTIQSRALYLLSSQSNYQIIKLSNYQNVSSDHYDDQLASRCRFYVGHSKLPISTFLKSVSSFTSTEYLLIIYFIACHLPLFAGHERDESGPVWCLWDCTKWYNLQL